MSSRKPILYFMAASPPCRAVSLVAAAIGLELETRDIDLSKEEQLTEEFTKMNPQHTLPTLDDNGVILYDSHVICCYLADKYGKDEKLYPKDLVKRSLVQTRLYFEAGFMFSRFLILVMPVLFEGYTEYPEDKKEYLKKTYDILERFLNDGPYVCGNEMTIADLSLVATASTLIKIVPYDTEKHKKILAWIARLEKLPYYKVANKNGADAGIKRFDDVLLDNLSKAK